MQVYMVGGAVRDKLLNLPIKDKDFVVVGANPKDMLQAGFIQVGADFPVFLHPTSKAEYALARTERKSGKGYKGFEVYAAPDVTLEQDLLRRDLTINAMAIEVAGLFDDTPITGDIIDPYSGIDDIKNRQLRHVSEAFSEDPLRVLRVARFYGRFYQAGSDTNFSIAQDTLNLIDSIVSSGELTHLTAERVWQETSRAIMQFSPQAYFDCLHSIGALPVLMPSLYEAWLNPKTKRLIDTSLQLAGQFGLTLTQRWAILLYSLAPWFTDTADTSSDYQYTSANITNPNQAAAVTTFIQPWIDKIKQLGQELKVPKKHTQFAMLYANCYAALVDYNQLEAEQICQFIQQTKANKTVDDVRELITTHHVIEIAKQHLALSSFVATYNDIGMQDIDPSLTGSDIGDALNAARAEAIANILTARVN